MIRVRKAAERGHFDHGWLDTYHTFSFGDYYDPAHMGFRSLRVINDDRVQPGQGFGMHGHRDMEIVTYVLEGALEHKDSMGNGSIIRAGELQRMTAGTGVRHSEFNPSDKEWVHLYQIWLLPERKGLEPSYEELAVERGAEAGPVSSGRLARWCRWLADHSSRRPPVSGLAVARRSGCARDRAWPGGVAPGSSREASTSSATISPLAMALPSRTRRLSRFKLRPQSEVLLFDLA